MLKRNRLLQEKWYDIFIDRIHLLIPKALPSHTKPLKEGDVVVFVFQVGVITKQISRSTFEIQYCNRAEGSKKFLRQDARHIALVYSVDEIPPTSTKSFQTDATQ
jgi:hypothetical protein